jgi:hypothetical protein
MLHNHVVQLLAARRCDDARAALPELPGDSIVDDVRRVCAP